jgi:SAM-dependent methyltransferase
LTDKYGPQAEGWSERSYGDARKYLQRRAELIAVGMPRGATVLDLACGDGGLGELLAARGLRYLGVDTSAEMVEAARARLGDDALVVEADLNDFAPADPVDATTVFRAVYYARDHDAFVRHVASYTRRKLVFDLNPRQYDVGDMTRRLQGAGFARVELRPFFFPQRFGLPFPLDRLARAAERSGPLARLALRYRFTYVVSAWLPGS